MELADTTVWAWTRRRAYSELRRWFDEAVIEGEVAVCDMVKLELLHSARNPSEFRETRAELEALPQVPTTQDAWSRALTVYEDLAQRGSAAHRKVKHADLLIAASAELADVALVHYDADYDEITSVTGQQMRRLAAKGSLR